MVMYKCCWFQEEENISCNHYLTVTDLSHSYLGLDLKALAVTQTDVHDFSVTANDEQDKRITPLDIDTAVNEPQKSVPL